MESTSTSSNPVTNSEGDVSENIVDTPFMHRVPEQEGASETPQLDTSPASEGESSKISNDFINLSTSGLRRSPRNHKPGNLPKHCLVSRFNNVKSGMSNMAYSIKATLTSNMEALNSYYDGTVDALQNSVYVSNKIVSNDTFTFGEVKKHPDRASFVEAMIAEINDHEERNH